MMNIGVKTLIYAYLVVLVYITFVNIYEMNKKLSMQKNRQIKLNKVKFLFFKNKEDSSLYHLKIVIIEIILYFLIICMIGGFIVSLFVKDSITFIIYAVLFVSIGILGIYSGYNRKRN